MNIGVLALQGDFEAHAKMLHQLGVTTTYVRKPEQLKDLHGLVLPGGESPTLLHFLQQDHFLEALQEFGQSGGHLFGTCAGAILLASAVTHPTQPSLGLVDVTVERNAFGRQMNSHIGWGEYKVTNEPMKMVFIRAPRIVNVGPHVHILATYQNHPVAVQQDRILLATFHPELSNTTTLHAYFIHQIATCQKLFPEALTQG